ncbi:MAG: lytic transglycosylase domain-containing protein [Rhodospirillales bacterium]|nr:lytic transglycosylase domain-containing protein [Rhodospirillales bacterium]
MSLISVLRVLFCLVVITLASDSSAQAADGRLGGPGTPEIATARAAFQAVDRGDWEEARRLSQRARDPVLRTLITWFDYARHDTEASFADISRFLAEHPEWPQRVLRRRAEESISPAEPYESVRAWFGEHTPDTANGSIRLALALLAIGDDVEANEVARKGWLNASFGAKEEEEFLTFLGHLLSPEDYRARLDFLLWRGREPEALRLLPKVDPGQRALAVARLRLREMDNGVDGAVNAVPAHLRNDPGLVYERLRWRRKKERDVDARALLRDYGPITGADPDRFWIERNILARRALAEGLEQQAYTIASQHGATSGMAFAEGEWLAGWIALRYLQDAKRAYTHFATMYDGVNYPISSARAAYWTARAAEARNNNQAAKEWLAKAARHPTTFYGQLAAQRLKPGAALQLPRSPEPSAEEAEAFAQHEVTRAVRILAAIGEQSRLWPFLDHLADLNDSGGWTAMAAGLATESGRPDVAIAIAKRAVRLENMLIEQGYPAVPVPRVLSGVPHDVEPPLVLAIIRQESAYRSDAISHAGARGLMQLMPATAKVVAQKLDLPFSETRLSLDPQYNLILGQAYMSRMLDRFDGSYVLSLAAYNAGPTRSNQWVQDYGDPRVSVDRAVDWVELIPFGETRNYVQRTLEHLQVYRRLLNGPDTPISLEGDLQR